MRSWTTWVKTTFGMPSTFGEGTEALAYTRAEDGEYALTTAAATTGSLRAKA